MSAPLTGVQVLEVEPGFGVYAGRLLASLGADVVTLVASEDEFPVFARHKNATVLAETDYTAEFHRSGRQYDVVGPLTSEGGRRALRAGLDAAGILLTGLRTSELRALDLTPAALRERHPRLVHLSVTPYGLDGPRAEDPACDLTVVAAGGLLSLAGEPGRAPTRPYGHQAVVAASLHGTFAALVALRVAEASGEGQLVDVSAHDAVAHSLENAAQFWDLEGVIRHRTGGEDPEAGNGLYACADGHVYLMTAMHGGLIGWDRFVRWLGSYDGDLAALLLHEQWLDMTWRRTNEAKVQFRQLFESFTLPRNERDLFVDGQANGVAIAPVADAMNLLSSPQLSERDFFRQEVLPNGRTVSFPGPPFRMSRTPADVALYPRLGAWLEEAR